MSFKLGNTSISQIYFGSTKIASAYLGSTKVYSAVPTVYLDFGKNGQSLPAANTVSHGTWSDTGTYYTLKVPLYYATGADPTRLGLARLFSDSNDDSLFDSTKGSYPLVAIRGDVAAIKTLDRTFNGATAISNGFYSALQSWISSNNFNVENVNQTFANLSTNLDNADDLYTALSSKASIQSHSSTFIDSGSSADRASIPVGWGGDLVPASTTLAGTVQNISSNKTIWLAGSTQPDWTNALGLYVFTTQSVSSYAGVSMNRSRINNKINNLQSASGNALYFRPAFFQFSSGSSGAFSWLLTTSLVNGNLISNQGNTDMPGTLDYSTYGPMDKEYGTYDSGKSVYFGFLVTNADPSSWTGFTDPYALLYNSNYRNTDFKWFL